jgi:hypothetical protein
MVVSGVLLFFGFIFLFWALGGNPLAPLGAISSLMIGGGIIVIIASLIDFIVKSVKLNGFLVFLIFMSGFLICYGIYQLFAFGPGYLSGWGGIGYMVVGLCIGGGLFIVIAISIYIVKKKK